MGDMVMKRGAEGRSGHADAHIIAVREIDDGSVILLYCRPSSLFAGYNNPKLTGMGGIVDGMIGMLAQSAAT